MLRLVALTLLLAVPLARAEEGEGGPIHYREPTTAELQRQQDDATAQLRQGEGYFQSPAFQESLARERAKLPSIPSVSPANHLDLPDNVLGQKWADRFNELEASAQAATERKPVADSPPLVFASLSLPRDTLRELAAAAHRAGGVVVFRGLKDDSFLAMRKALAELGEGFAIDPTLFQRFAVAEVPTFVLPVEPLLPCDIDGCPEVRHVRLVGNLTLDAALDYMRINSREEGGKDAAAYYLKKLRDQ